MGAGWGDLRVWPCGALTRTVPGLDGEAGCVRGQTLPCTEGAREGRIEQEDSLKKKKTLGGTLGNSPAATAPVSSPPGHLPFWECAHRPGSVCTHWSLYAPTWECPHLISEGAETTGTGESANQGRPRAHTQSPEEGECLNLWVWGPLESWAGGCPTADRDREELG